MGIQTFQAHWEKKIIDYFEQINFGISLIPTHKASFDLLTSSGLAIRAIIISRTWIEN